MAPKKNTNAAASATPEVATPTPAPVVEAPPAEAPSTEPPVEATSAAPSTLADEIAGLIKFLESSQTVLKTLGIQYKQAIKDAQQAKKKIEQLEKSNGRRNKGRAAKAAAAAEGASVNRKPSGFATPAMLSKELSDFLGVPEGTKLARTEVTRRITEYVKANSLFDAADKRNIRTDEKLKQILGGDSDKPLTYFNLQSFIKHHFLKPEAATSAPAHEATA